MKWVPPAASSLMARNTDRTFERQKGRARGHISIQTLGMHLPTVFAALLLALTPLAHAQASPSPKARLLVLTDIEADPDDTQSLVRLLLYSNEIDLEGLVATTSIHMRSEIHPDSIRVVLDAYDKVRANLLQHAPGYPATAALRALVVEGQPAYGMAAVGKGKDTAGSRLIVKALDSRDPRPLWVTAWGGPNTLAQALFTLRETRGADAVARLLTKLRVHTISDQDDSGAWLRREFPDLFYIVSPGGYGGATWTGIHHVVSILGDHPINQVVSNRWLAENIQQGHGALGAVYPDVAYAMEGDTPSFLSLIPNGLNAPENPSWGGWGGRYELYLPSLQAIDANGFTGGVPVEPESRAIWTNAIDKVTPDVRAEHGRATRPGDQSSTGYRETLWRWRVAIQNDFAARMDWTSRLPKDANHPPVPRLRHDSAVAVRAGERFSLDAGASSDPDGDSLSHRWYLYPEAGSWKAPVEMLGADNLYRRGFVAPRVTKRETAHFILEVTDKGVPPLTRYQRVIVTIDP
jgi:hypothetical protein